MSELPRAVLFDYGLVLSGPADPEAWEEMRGALDAEENAFAEAYWRSRHAYDSGELNGNSYWETVGEDLSRIVTAEQREALKAADVRLWTKPNQPMIEWAAALRRAGFVTGILSNIGDAMEEGLWAKCPWIGEFKHRTFSHRLKMAKPELAIYRSAAEGLGAEPGEILFIDDRTENVEAARVAGMRAVWYTDQGEFEARMRAEGLSAMLTPEI